MKSKQKGDSALVLAIALVLWVAIVLCVALTKSSRAAEPEAADIKVGLVEFTSAGCKPSKQMEPIIQQLQADPKSGYKVIREIDIDDDEDLTRWANVQDTPTFIVYVNKVEFMRHVGKVKRKELLKWARDAASAANRPAKPADPKARNWAWIEDTYGQGHFVKK